MTEYTETPTNNSSPNFLTIYKEDNGGNLINAGTGISARTRFQVNGTLTSNDVQLMMILLLLEIRVIQLIIN